MKRNCIKALPHTLVMHLKRFEFDYETMARLKIKDRRAERLPACPSLSFPSWGTAGVTRYDLCVAISMIAP